MGRQPRSRDIPWLSAHSVRVDLTVATAFALTYRLRRWYIVGWVLVEETVGFQQETNVCRGHHGVILWSGDVRVAEGVPEDDISIRNRAVCLGPFLQAVAPLTLIGEVPGRIF